MAVLEPSVRNVDWVDGSVCAIRRDDFNAIGGLTEGYFLYFEDVDFGWKVRTHLEKAVICDLNITASQSPGGALDQYLATRNLLWLFRRQGLWVALSCYAMESCLRLVIGPLLKPAGSVARARRRWHGLFEGLASKSGANGPERLARK